MSMPLTIEKSVRFRRRGRSGRRQVESETESLPRGRIPRISRLMALAIRFDELIRAGHVTNYAELARLGKVTRNRVSQIMNLLLLAPEIQEELLFLPRVEQGEDPVYLKDLQVVAKQASWEGQRNAWASCLR